MNVLKAMGIQQWQRRGARPVAVPDSEQVAQLAENTDVNDSQPPSAEFDLGANHYDFNAAEPAPLPPMEQTANPSGSTDSQAGFPSSLKGALNKTESPAEEKTSTDSPAKEANTSDKAAKKVLPLDISDLLGAESDASNEVQSQEHVTHAQESVPEAQYDDYYVPEEDDSDGTLVEPVISDHEDKVLPASGHDISVLDWDGLQSLIETNVHCPSCGWGNSILGYGAQNADWMFVIDAPNSREIEAKEFFVGRAGQLFDSMLMALGLDRNAVYSTSVFKCAPTEDLSVTPQCDGLLHRQIELVKPKVIITFGEFTAQSVLKSNTNLDSLRQSQQQHTLTKTRVVPTFSPAEMLDDTQLKSKVWQDLKKAIGHFA